MDQPTIDIATLTKVSSFTRPVEALYLGEGNPLIVQPIDRTGNVLAPLSSSNRQIVTARASIRRLGTDAKVLSQGKRYNEIYIIQTGRVRTYYISPSGREYTLAYWTPGHFVGVPELFGTGENLWSAATTMPTTLAALSSEDLRFLLRQVPSFAMSLIEGLVYKGRVLSAALQMLGTRSMTSRLAQLLITLAARHGRRVDCYTRIEQRFTHDELGKMIGSTRQWVTTTLAQFRAKGLVSCSQQYLCLLNEDGLRKLVR